MNVKQVKIISFVETSPPIKADESENLAKDDY